MAKQDRNGTNDPPGSVAGNGPLGQPGSERNGPTPFKTGCPHHPHSKWRGNGPIIIAPSYPRYFTRKHAEGIDLKWDKNPLRL